jgi:hypothetical protein
LEVRSKTGPGFGIGTEPRPDSTVGTETRNQTKIFENKIFEGKKSM